MALTFLKKLFGKGKTSNAPKEMNNIMEQMRQTIFPGGTAQMKAELDELSSILGVQPDRIRDTFGYACARVNIGKCDRETLMFGIARHDDGLSDDQIEKFAKYIFTKQFKQSSGITDPTFIEAFLNAQGFLSDNYGGLKYDEIPGGYGEFGITMTNPVPVNGILASDKYLDGLETIDGFSIKWNRLGSGGADNIDNPIDIYKITDINGRERDIIYISPYHSSTSNKAPKGYKIKN